MSLNTYTQICVFCGAHVEDFKIGAIDGQPGGIHKYVKSCCGKCEKEYRDAGRLEELAKATR